MRNGATLTLICLVLAGCGVLDRDTPSTFIVFFAGKSTDLTPEGHTIVNDAAAKVRALHPASVLIEAGVTAGSNMDLSEPRFAAVRQALIAGGVPQDLIARSAIPGPKLDGSKTGDQRVEIRLLSKAP